MTALDRYVRLESDALWRDSSSAQRRDVVIAFGDATLVISDQAGRPLSHWSLTALIRQNEGEMPALYAPDEAASEMLEIADQTMVEAIEQVRKALAKSRPRPGKLRYWLTALFFLVALMLSVFWLPDALTRQTLAVLPQAKRVEIGKIMMGHLVPETGQPCQSRRTEEAAANLAARLFGTAAPFRIVVVPRLQTGALALPGGLFLLDQEVMQQTDDPAAAAGFILAARAQVVENTPLRMVLQEAGLPATLRLLTTGDIDDAILQANALRRVQTPAEPPDRGVFVSLMQAAQIPTGPYRAAYDGRTGNTPELGADPLQGVAVPLILTDSDWVVLRNACNS